MAQSGSTECRLFHFRRSRMGRRFTFTESIKQEFFSSRETRRSFHEYWLYQNSRLHLVKTGSSVSKLSEGKKVNNSGTVINEPKEKARKCYGHQLSPRKDGYFQDDEDKAMEKSGLDCGKMQLMRKSQKSFTLFWGPCLWMTLLIMAHFLLQAQASDTDRIKLRHAASETKSSGGRLFKFSAPGNKNHAKDLVDTENDDTGRLKKVRNTSGDLNTEPGKPQAEATLLSILTHEERFDHENHSPKLSEHSHEKHARPRSTKFPEISELKSFSIHAANEFGFYEKRTHKYDHQSMGSHHKANLPEEDIHGAGGAAAASTDSMSSPNSSKKHRNFNQHLSSKGKTSDSSHAPEDNIILPAVIRENNKSQSADGSRSNDVVSSLDSDARMSSSHPPHLLENFKQSLKVAHNKKHSSKLSSKPAKKQEKLSRNPKERHHVSKKTRQNKTHRKRTEGVAAQLSDSQVVLEQNTQRLSGPSGSMKSKGRQEIDGSKVAQLGGQLNFQPGKRRSKSSNESQKFADKKHAGEEVPSRSVPEVSEEGSGRKSSDYQSNSSGKIPIASNSSEKLYKSSSQPAAGQRKTKNLSSEGTLIDQMEKLMHSVFIEDFKPKRSEDSAHTNHKNRKREHHGFQNLKNDVDARKGSSKDDKISADNSDDIASQSKTEDNNSHAEVKASVKQNFKFESDHNSETKSGSKPGSEKRKDDTEGYQSDQGRHIYNTPLTSRLELLNGLYHGLTVAVTSRVSADHCRDVIEGLKTSLQGLSFAMYKATDGMAGLGSVTIQLPPEWGSRSCIPPSTAPGEEPPITTQNPQIIVDSPHSVFGDAPWTQQSGGCGEQGNFIQLGVNFLKSANASDSSGERSGKVMLAEWAKYRWGVFSESGHKRDPLYPPWYSAQPPSWEPNVCSDVVSLAHTPACPPHLNARCPWPHAAVENATSSLLATPQLPKVAYFCTPATHNSEAPTKHNALCGGRSAWEIIRQSKDFRNMRVPRGPPAKPPPTPRLFFTLRPPLRFVLLVEDTAVMNVQRRWDFVRKSVRRAIVYDLPDDARAGVIVFNERSKEVSPLSTLESVSDLRERVGSSLPRNPSSVRASQACIPCALQAATNLLREGGESSRGATIILLTAGDQSRSAQAEEVRRVAADEGLRIVLVLYPLQERPGLPIPPHSLVPIARESGGSVFTVMDEGVGTDSKVNMLVSLMEALRSAVRAGEAETPILVHSASYPGGVAPHSTGTFSLDSSLASHARFAVYYYDLNHVGNAIHLTAPSGTTFASVNMQEEDGDVNMIFVNLHNAEKGVWRYKVENRADSHQGLHIQVTAQPNAANDVTVRVWTSQGEDELPQADQQKPIVLYGEVKVGGVSVLNAGVLATLQRLGTNATGGTYPPVNVPLLDLGTGDPDITRGDGIYSRYAPPLDGPSRYALTLSVDASKAVLALAQNFGSSSSSSSSSYSAYRTTGSSPYSSESSYEGTTTFKTTGSSHDPIESYHTHDIAESTLASRELTHGRSLDRLQSFSSSESLRKENDDSHGPEEHHNFVESAEIRKPFVSSLHSIETHLEDQSGPFQAPGSSQSLSAPTYPSSSSGRFHPKSTNNIKHKDLGSSEERPGLAPSRYRGRSHAKLRSDYDKARHHRRRRAGLEREDPTALGWSSPSLHSYYSDNHLHAGEMDPLPDPEKGWGMPSPPCCGSVVPYAHTRQAPPFTRVVTGPTVEIWHPKQKDVDVVAPGRIADLTAWVNSSTGNVVLEWTAVGSDRDWGRASRYLAAVTSSKAQAANSCSGKQLRGLPHPAPAGEREEATVDLTVNERTLYVCVRAVDAAGNSGAPSNAAPVWLPRPPAIDRVTLRDQGLGSGFSSGLGSGGHGGGERVAVIAGSVGGVLLVLLLLVSYCYCFPGGFAKRNQPQRRNGLNQPEEHHKNGGNGQMPLVNGGSLLVTSASRGSVLLNMNEEGGNSPNKEASPSLRRAPNASRNRGNAPSDEVGSPERNEEFPRALEPPLRNANAEDSDTQRGLSMSIPDVTRVEPQVSTAAIASETSQPQFFTLGRNAARNHSNSSSTSSRHSFHDRSVSSSGTPQSELQQRSSGPSARFNSAPQNHFQQVQNQPHDPQAYHKPPTMAHYNDSCRSSNAFPTTAGFYRGSHDDSDAGPVAHIDDR